MSPALTSASVTELASLIRTKKSSALEVLDAHLQRIERYNPAINAIVRLDTERARRRAREADEALARGENWGPLHGVPFTLKDMHETRDIGSSFGTRASERVGDVDGVVAERLKRAGGILLGKTNMANSLQTVSEQFGRSSNPHDRSRTTGGSSGGAAAAIAAGLSPFDVGTDMSGSIRMPAHFCGVFGLRPTMHRIPAANVVFGPPGIPRVDRTFGAVGPMARTADDVALLFRVLAGADARDPEVPPVAVVDAPKPDVRGLRIAVAPSVRGIRVAESIRSGIAELATRLSDAGARVEEREPVIFDELLAAFRRHFLGLLSMAKRAGMAVPGAHPADLPDPTPYDMALAQAERDRFIDAAERFFADYDAFLCPAATVVAFPHCPPRCPIDVDGESLPSVCVDHPTIFSTYTGSPSLVVPIAKDARGLPIGAQLVGRKWHDENLLALGSTVADLVGPLSGPALAPS
jgi:amidase